LGNYLNEKIYELSRKDISHLASHMELVMTIYLKMNNYNSLYNSIREVMYKNNQR